MELLQYGIIIVLALGLVGYFTYLYKTKGKEYAFLELRHDVLKAIFLAEKKFGDNEGNLKFDWVADRVYNVIPVAFKFLITEKELADLIQDVYESVKSIIDPDDDKEKGE